MGVWSNIFTMFEIISSIFVEGLLCGGSLRRLSSVRVNIQYIDLTCWIISGQKSDRPWVGIDGN